MVETLKKMGGWPVIEGENWNGDNWYWIESNKIIAEEGITADLILDIRIISDTKNSLKRTISVIFFIAFSFKQTLFT